VTEDAAQRDVHQARGVVGLRGHVQDGDDGADEDEEERAIDAGANAGPGC
jgi:hypothetical protein